jgi:hypothetical protein
MTDHEVEVILTPERIKLYERAMVIGLPAIVVSMYGDRIQKLIDDERNKVASWMMTKGYATGHGDTTEDLLDELDWQITESWSKVVVASVEAEREACAKVCEDKNTLLAWPTYAAAIRARGQA